MPTGAEYLPVESVYPMRSGRTREVSLMAVYQPTMPMPSPATTASMTESPDWK